MNEAALGAAPDPVGLAPDPEEVSAGGTPPRVSPVVVTVGLVDRTSAIALGEDEVNFPMLAAATRDPALAAEIRKMFIETVMDVAAVAQGTMDRAYIVIVFPLPRGLKMERKLFAATTPGMSASAVM